MKGKKKEGLMDMVWGLPVFHSDGTSVPTMKGERETRRGKCRGSVSRIRLSTRIKEMGGKEGKLCLCLIFPVRFLLQV